MKVWKALLVILVSGVLVATFAGCGSKKTSTTGTSVYTVKKGDISNTITAAGNLALAQTQDVAIDLFYPNGVKGTIASVNVQLGNSVKAGEVLVTIDQSEWNDQLTILQSNLTTAQRNLTQMQSNLMSANQTLVNLMDTSSLTKAILNAQISLETAQANLATAVSAIDFYAAYAALQKAQTYYDYVNNVLRFQMLTKLADWELALQGAQDRLTQAQTNYDNVLAGYDTTDVAQKKQQVQIAQMNLDAAKQALANNPQLIASQQIQVTLSQGKVDDAVKAVSDAQKKMNDAQAMSPEITAPFDGFVTAVNVKAARSAEWYVAVTVADPNKFEANILVSEMDIMKVNVGGRCHDDLKCHTGRNPAGQNYSNRPYGYHIIGRGQLCRHREYNLSSRLLPPVQCRASTANATGRQPGGASGNFTTRAGVTPSAGPGSSSSGSRAASQLPSRRIFQLKQGLSGTVRPDLSQASNVLLVPNTAITKAGNQSTVKVMTANNTIEKRTMQTGLADWQNTQITSGLNEGEKIVMYRRLLLQRQPRLTAETRRRRNILRQVNDHGR